MKKIKEKLIEKRYEQLAEIISLYLPVRFLRLYFRLYRKKGENLYNHIKKQYGENIYTVICPYSGTGDVYLASGFLKEFLNKNSISDYVLVVIGKSNYNIGKLFGISQIINYSEEKIKCLVKYLMFYGLDEKSVLLAHPSSPYMHYGINDWLRNYDGINFMEMYARGVFSIPSKCFRFPKFENNYEEIRKIIKDYDLPKGKTILISPYSNTLFQFPVWFWRELSEKLKKVGYTVCTNCGSDNEKEIEGTKRIFLPYKNLQFFLEYAGTFIGIRSGFCDIISSINCKKIVLFQPFLFWGAGDNIDYFSLNGMGLCKDAIELQLNGIEFLDLIDTIVKKVEDS